MVIFRAMRCGPYRGRSLRDIFGGGGLAAADFRSI